MRIVFIGIGNMGGEMVLHLIAAGHTLTGYTRGAGSRERALGLGINLADTPAAVAKSSEVVFTIVTAGKDVETSRSARTDLCMALNPDWSTWT